MRTLREHIRLRGQFGRRQIGSEPEGWTGDARDGHLFVGKRVPNVSTVIHGKYVIFFGWFSRHGKGRRDAARTRESLSE